MADAEAGAAGKHGADGESEDESSGWETEEDEPETLAAAATVPPVGAAQNNKPDEEGEDEESEWETEESDNEEELDPNTDWDPLERWEDVHNRLWAGLAEMAGTENPRAMKEMMESVAEDIVEKELEALCAAGKPLSSCTTGSLPPKAEAEIDALCAIAGNLVDSKKKLAEWQKEALKRYHCGVLKLQRLPHPWFIYCGTAKYLLLAITDMVHRLGKWQLALSTAQLCMFVEGAVGEPYAHYLKGQILFDMGQLDRAEDDLGRALLGDERLFEPAEGDNPARLAEMQKVAKRGAAKVEAAAAEWAKNKGK